MIRVGKVLEIVNKQGNEGRKSWVSWRVYGWRWSWRVHRISGAPARSHVNGWQGRFVGLEETDVSGGKYRWLALLAAAESWLYGPLYRT